MCAVYDGLKEYMDFYNGHKEFLNKMNLDHAQLTQKMRVLSLISMAEKNPEVSFSQIERDLDLPADQVERFIIDALKTRLLTARIDQAARKVVVQAAVKRALSKPHWVNIRDTLARWKASIHHIKENLHELDTPQN